MTGTLTSGLSIWNQRSGRSRKPVNIGAQKVGHFAPHLLGWVLAVPEMPGLRFWPISGAGRTFGSKWPDHRLARPLPTSGPRAGFAAAGCAAVPKEQGWASFEREVQGGRAQQRPKKTQEKNWVKTGYTWGPGILRTRTLAHVHELWGAAAAQTPRLILGGSRPTPGSPG